MYKWVESGMNQYAYIMNCNLNEWIDDDIMLAIYSCLPFPLSYQRSYSSQMRGHVCGVGAAAITASFSRKQVGSGRANGRCIFGGCECVWLCCLICRGRILCICKFSTFLSDWEKQVGEGRKGIFGGCGIQRVDMYLLIFIWWRSAVGLCWCLLTHKNFKIFSYTVIYIFLYVQTYKYFCRL